MSLGNFILYFLFILFVVSVLSMINYFNTKNKLRRYEIDIRTEVTEKDLEMLDTLIKDTFNEYILLNTGYEKVEYISDEQEEKLYKELSLLVSNRISETLFNKLALAYNRKEIPTISLQQSKLCY